MSNVADTPSETTNEPETAHETRTATLAAQVETLKAENDRLRRALSDATRQRYRRTAFGLFAIGLVALGGAALFPALQTVLVALGVSGVFAALLTYLITPERFVAASVGERVYATLAGNEAAIVDDLDLRGEHRIVPTADSVVPARLFISIETGAPIPDDEQLNAPFVTGETPGVALEPTGVPLYDVFTDANPATPTTPAELAVAVSDALIEQFELVDGIDTAVENGRATMSVSGSVYGAVDRFDHPVASFLATSLAVELETPITVTIDEDDGQGDWLVTCRWDSDDVAEAS